MNEKKYHLSDVAFYFLILILLLVAYFPSFTGEFVGDDIARVAQVDELANASFGKILESSLGDRPVLLISLWVDRHIFGLSGGLMRFETLLFLGLLALVMRNLINDLSGRFNLSILPLWRDGLILLYCLHPLNTQALTHVCQRGIIFSSLGGLLTTLLLLKSNFSWKKLSWRIALLVWILALLSKPNIAFLPLFWVILGLQIGVGKKQLLSILPFFVMLLIPVLNYTIGEFNIQETLHTASPLNYFLLQGKVLLIYAKLILIPIELRFNHDIHMPIAPQWWPGAALWITYIGFVFWVLKVKKQKIVGIFLIGALLSFLPESSFFPIMHPIFEHRTFFPMAFMAITLVLALNNSSLSKWSFLLISVLTILSVILDYRRNLQTQKFSVWAETELSHTCNLEYMQIYFVHRLVAGDYYAEARRGLDKISACADKKIMLPCLEAIYSFASAKTLDMGSMATLRNCLHSDLAWEKPPRQSINSLVVKKVQATVSEDKKACYMEDFFSTQLRYFKKFRSKFGKEINFYAMSAERCLSDLKIITTPQANFQKLKIRTIKRYHFGVPDSKLADDLAKAPDTEDYKYLRSLLETAPKL